MRVDILKNDLHVSPIVFPYLSRIDGCKGHHFNYLVKILLLRSRETSLWYQASVTIVGPKFLLAARILIPVWERSLDRERNSERD